MAPLINFTMFNTLASCIKSPIHAMIGGQFTILQVVAFIGNGRQPSSVYSS